MGKLKLNGLQFHAYHGVFEEEQKIGAPYIIDLELEGDYSHASASDELENTVNYQEVYQLVEKQMEQKAKLIEHLASRILDAILESFPLVQKATIVLHKVNPPIHAVLKSVSFELSKTREQ